MRVKKLSDFMKEIRIVRSKNNTPEIWVGNSMDSLVSEAIIFFDRACFTLDYSLHFGVQTDFVFRNDTGLESALIHFKDKNYYTSRPIYEQKLNHVGPPLASRCFDGSRLSPELCFWVRGRARGDQWPSGVVPGSSMMIYSW